MLEQMRKSEKLVVYDKTTWIYEQNQGKSVEKMGRCFEEGCKKVGFRKETSRKQKCMEKEDQVRWTKHQ